MTADEILGLLRDTAQGASNSAASTVSAPVDVLAWLLRKGGVPVGPAPVLGSDWMAQKGLTAQPKNALAGMAGETIGNVLPIVAAAKAPQIANALMRADEALTNQLGPTIANAAEQYMVKTGMMQPATVWHGSPHKFDKFDASKIGTGEGAQAYGYGLYLADSNRVADGYAKRLSIKGSDVLVNGQKVDPGSQAGSVARDIAELMRYDGLSQQEAQKKVASELSRLKSVMLNKAAELDEFVTKGVAGYSRLEAINAKNMADEYAQQAKIASEFAGVVENTTSRNLYKVDLPDSAIARMLDWDKPLSQQAPEVQKAVTDAMLKRGITKSVADYIVANKTGNEALATISRGAYDARLNVPDGPQAAAASQMLQSAGIPGIRYLDGGSRGAGAGTSNYVIFPGEENLLRILERNGVPIGN